MSVKGCYTIHDSFSILMKYDVILQNIHSQCRYKIESVTPSLVTLGLLTDSYSVFTPGRKYSEEYEPSLKLHWDYKKVRKHFIVWEGD